MKKPKVKNIFYDKMYLRLFYFDVMNLRIFGEILYNLNLP